MIMLKNTQKPIKFQIKDLAKDQAEALAARELKLEELNMVVGGQRPESGYLCSANGTPRGDCWME